MTMNTGLRKLALGVLILPLMLLGLGVSPVAVAGAMFDTRASADLRIEGFRLYNFDTGFGKGAFEPDDFWYVSDALDITSTITTLDPPGYAVPFQPPGTSATANHAGSATAVGNTTPPFPYASDLIGTNLLSLSSSASGAASGANAEAHAQHSEQGNVELFMNPTGFDDILAIDFVLDYSIDILTSVAGTANADALASIRLFSKFFLQRFEQDPGDPAAPFIYFLTDGLYPDAALDVASEIFGVDEHYNEHNFNNDAPVNIDESFRFSLLVNPFSRSFEMLSLQVDVDGYTGVPLPGTVLLLLLGLFGLAVQRRRTLDDGRSYGIRIGNS